jgi:arylsulfatase A-like enzyme
VPTFSLGQACSLLLCLLLAAATQAAPPPSRPPSFIVIVIDDLGGRDLGCYGSTYHKTPHIARLAVSGLRFTNAYAACPVCSPTRASILTGKYPARLHLTDWLPGRADRPDQKLLRPKIRQQLPLEEVTLAEALRPRGYVSASIGKWHLGGKAYWPEKQGFDLNRGGTDTGSPPGGYFRFRTPSLSARGPDEYLTDRLTEEAEQFLEHNYDRPFFLYLAHYAVHIPLQARPDLLARHKERERPAEGQNNPIYAAMLESVDQSVGRLVRRLRDLEIADNTVLIFTSDNGGLSVREGPNTPATSNAPLRAGKGYLYEGGIRVPLLVSWPGVTRAGAVSDVPVCSIDLFSTLLDGAGVPARERPAVDGVSLLPLLRGGEAPERSVLYWHYPHYSNQGGKPGGAVRQGDWKLLEHYEDGKLELYNLKEDVGEAKDLAEQNPDRVRRLHGLLRAWRHSVAAQMPTTNPDYRPPGKR